ncbi:unnamed protein product [Owenia fusiformis]|uniref:Uncharacterized protein n=1 Tax=Owenia fusiformis TaxID=6347 RepID=A0A8J1U6P6_OWEFU|nr:unnamed protein product [Owenia fusiformis]
MGPSNITNRKLKDNVTAKSKFKNGTVNKTHQLDTPKVSRALAETLRSCPDREGTPPRSEQVLAAPTVFGAEGGSLNSRPQDNTSDVIVVQHQYADTVPVSSKASNPHPTIQGGAIDQVMAMLTTIQQSQDKFQKHQESLQSSLDSIHTKMVEQENRIIEKVNTKIDNLKTETTKEVDSLRTNLQSQINNLESAFKASTEQVECVNIVIKNIEESLNENCETKINELLKDGLKLDASVVSATRQTKREGSKYPGLIIAKVCKQDKHRIMKNKKSLKNSAKYAKVYLEDFQTQELRKMNYNMRTVLSAAGKENQFVLRNGVFQKKLQSTIPNVNK